MQNTKFQRQGSTIGRPFLISVVVNHDDREKPNYINGEILGIAKIAKESDTFVKDMDLVGSFVVSI